MSNVTNSSPTVTSIHAQALAAGHQQLHHHIHQTSTSSALATFLTRLSINDTTCFIVPIQSALALPTLTEYSPSHRALLLFSAASHTDQGTIAADLLSLALFAEWTECWSDALFIFHLRAHLHLHKKLNVTSSQQSDYWCDAAMFSMRSTVRNNEDALHHRQLAHSCLQHSTTIQQQQVHSKSLLLLLCQNLEQNKAQEAQEIIHQVSESAAWKQATTITDTTNEFIALFTTLIQECRGEVQQPSQLSTVRPTSVNSASTSESVADTASSQASASQAQTQLPAVPPRTPSTERPSTSIPLTDRYVMNIPQSAFIHSLKPTAISTQPPFNITIAAALIQLGCIQTASSCLRLTADKDNGVIDDSTRAWSTFCSDLITSLSFTHVHQLQQLKTSRDPRLAALYNKLHGDVHFRLHSFDTAAGCYERCIQSQAITVTPVVWSRLKYIYQLTKNQHKLQETGIRHFVATETGDQMGATSTGQQAETVLSSLAADLLSTTISGVEPSGIHSADQRLSLAESIVNIGESLTSTSTNSNRHVNGQELSAIYALLLRASQLDPFNAKVWTLLSEIQSKLLSSSTDVGPKVSAAEQYRIQRIAAYAQQVAGVH